LDFATVIFLQSKVVSLKSNPPTWRTIYVPQWQGGPVIPAGTRFPFRRLLRLARLRWRCSNPPPYGDAWFISKPNFTCLTPMPHYLLLSNRKLNTDFMQPSFPCPTFYKKKESILIRVT
jgi:hypothetical protein